MYHLIAHLQQHLNHRTHGSSSCCLRPSQHLPPLVPFMTGGRRDTSIKFTRAVQRAAYINKWHERETGISISPCSWCSSFQAQMQLLLSSLWRTHILPQIGPPSKQQSLCRVGWVSWSHLVLSALLSLSASRCSRGNTTHWAPSFGCLGLIRSLVWWFIIEIWVTKN